MKIRHILGISGGRDSAALAIYMKNKYPNIDIEYYNSDTGCELEETEILISRLESYLGGVIRLRAAEESPEPTPFEHFLKANGNFLPSPQSRWCTQKMKLREMEKFVGDEPAISYVAIRGDEFRDGYISTKPNIQAIFPFRRNIWSMDVINLIFNSSNIAQLVDIYENICPAEFLESALTIIREPLTRKFYYSKKLNGLLDIDVRTFNKAVFLFLKTTDLPVGKLDEFPLVENEDVLIKEDINAILEDTGIGLPGYYNPIEFEVDGQVGTYCRSRSGCYFCFFQQKIEWIWLLEQHPDLYQKAMEFEKNGYTWNQNESLEQLRQPERVRQIKLDTIKKQKAERELGDGTLAKTIEDDDEILCTNCFI